MRTWKLVGIGAVCLVLLASMAGPANAATVYPVTTFVSGLTSQGTKPDNSNRMVLDVVDGNGRNGAAIQMWRQNGLPQQDWTIYRLPKDETGYYSYVLKNWNSLKCLDMAIDGAIGNGTRVQQWACPYPEYAVYQQRWYGIPVTNTGPTAPWIMLRSALTENLCLDVSGYNSGNGARLQVFTCHGGWNQRFNVS